METKEILLKEEKDNNTPSWKEILKFAAFAIIIVIPVRVFIAQPFIVSGQSMVPTFNDKDYLIVDEISYRFSDPKRGDVIIFRYPNNPKKFFIKRIIGLPGESIKIIDNIITVYNKEHPEGFNLYEPYVKNISFNNMSQEIGLDEYFVMGDNRLHSLDSRSWGNLPADNIVGKAFIRLIPINAISYLPGSYKYEN